MHELIKNKIKEDQKHNQEGGLDISHDNYRIFRSDKRNIDLVKYRVSVSTGSKTHAEGEEYVASDILGHYGTLKAALKALREDVATSLPANDLKTLQENIKLATAIREG